jgi:hypothetical protein
MYVRHGKETNWKSLSKVYFDKRKFLVEIDSFVSPLPGCWDIGGHDDLQTMDFKLKFRFYLV